MHIGERIRQARTANGLTQADLAGRLGVTPQAISQYERGVKNPKIETVKKIAAALGIAWQGLYPANEADPAVQEWGPDPRTPSRAYWYRVDSAAAYLLSLLDSAEHESGTQFSGEDENLWMKQKVPEVAALYNVSEADLDDFNHWRYPEGEEFLQDIHEAIYGKPIRFRSLEKICRTLLQMTPEGQALAAARVEELAQIPKYRRTPDNDTPKEENAE